ncbi:hypothetical protein B0H19DRAFT_1085008 [Mycena capillaripes]|nr:hypothetical protein B0H19DRAFT_1085008 [Mycena capillaripes]
MEEDTNHIRQMLEAVSHGVLSDIAPIPLSSLSRDVQELVNICQCHQTNLLHNHQIMAVKGASALSVYSETGGKNGRHAWVSDCSSITAASNIPTQVYEYMSGGRQFRTVAQALQHLRVLQFALVPSASFLCLLGSLPEPINVGIRLLLSDSMLFKTFNERSVDIVTAVKSLMARKKSSGAEKGKKKVMDMKLDSDDKISDFPDCLV